ncbi:hypothetical protein DFJ73DRAFT_223876 [Zopfochytrium polystomum]|nr:hypothetical protein DFJ73DRAFT_223876 [Zopfochytrium polystomum]
MPAAATTQPSPAARFGGGQWTAAAAAGKGPAAATAAAAAGTSTASPAWSAAAAGNGGNSLGSAPAAELLWANGFPVETVAAFARRGFTVDQLATINPESIEFLQDEFHLNDPKLKFKFGEVVRRLQLARWQPPAVRTGGSVDGLPGYAP